MLYIFGKALIAPLLWLIFRPKRLGFSRLNVRGKAIIVSNHWALTDPILVGCVCPRIIHFMAKQELFASRFSRLLMKALFAFSVDRDRADIASLKKAKDLLDRGKVFGIFPEGKRSITGEIDELEKGAAFLALRCGAPIIPVYSDPNTFRRLRIRMIVGEPIDAAAIAKSRKGKAVDVVTAAVADRLKTLKTEMEARY